MKNIEPWCISRQLWWGHQIPAWYTEDGNIIVAENIKEAKKIAKKKFKKEVILKQDPDVLDTWFSSALWPFATLGWPNHKSYELKRFYKTSVLVTKKGRTAKDSGLTIYIRIGHSFCTFADDRSYRLYLRSPVATMITWEMRFSELQQSSYLNKILL